MILCDNNFTSFCSPSSGKVRLCPDPKEYQSDSDEPCDQIFRNVHCKFLFVQD